MGLFNGMGHLPMATLLKKMTATPPEPLTDNRPSEKGGASPAPLSFMVK